VIPAHYKESINTFQWKRAESERKEGKEKEEEENRRVGPCERNDAVIKAKHLIIIVIFHMYSGA
jgi:hypothetical protein